MDNKTWKNWKETIYRELTKREESTNELFNKHYINIISKRYLFNYNELLVKNIKNIKLTDIQKCIIMFIHFRRYLWKPLLLN